MDRGRRARISFNGTRSCGSNVVTTTCCAARQRTTRSRREQSRWAITRRNHERQDEITRMAFRSYRAASFNFGSYRGTGAGARVLQRRCACGSKSESDGQCAECAEKEGVLQRKSSSGRTGEAPPIVYDVLRAPGQPLDTESRDFMEARFGYDFSS